MEIKLINERTFMLLDINSIIYYGRFIVALNINMKIIGVLV